MRPAYSDKRQPGALCNRIEDQRRLAGNGWEHRSRAGRQFWVELGRQQRTKNVGKLRKVTRRDA